METVAERGQPGADGRRAEEAGAAGDPAAGAPSKRHGRRALWAQAWKVALALGLLCAAGAGTLLSQSSAVTSTQTNPGNAFATGTVLVNGSPNGTALFDVTNAVPGDSWTNTYTLENVGSMPATLTLSVTSVTGTALASRLTVEVTDTTTGQGVAGLTAASATTMEATSGQTYQLPGWNGSATTAQWAPSETHVLSFTVSFPAVAGGDNSLQNQSASFTFAVTGDQ